ncbi:MAG TPA: HD domain-containing protein [Phycisphaerales bacterium]|nr:HD domain-containing protein [Phycisphaerales bacterium]
MNLWSDRPMSDVTAPPAGNGPAAAASKSNLRKFIRDLGPNEWFSANFCIANAQLAVTRNGEPYLACLLSDRTGQAPARRWNMPPEHFKQLPTEGFVFAEGRTQPFKGELQFIIERIEGIQPSSDVLMELLPVAPRPIDDMFAELLALLDTVQHPAMKALVKAYLEDEVLITQFKQAPAAKMMHHAYLGGLLEHTLALLKLANVVCPLYPKINRDIVMMGLFLHDIGKTRELAYDGAFAYTDRGELIGHIVEGAIILHDKAQNIMRSQGLRFPRNTITVLQHIILSHHGVPEFGAAKIPATPEAILVSLLDNVDAKTTIALNAARPDRAKPFDLGGNFTEKQWALDTKLFRPDPLA